MAMQNVAIVSVPNFGHTDSSCVAAPGLTNDESSRCIRHTPSRLFMSLFGLLLVGHRVHEHFKPPPVCRTCQAHAHGLKNVSGACYSRIPRIIHQSYKTANLPARWADVPQAWRTTHPNWEYRFWSDKENRELVRTSFPWLLETYDGYKYPIQRADVARYLVIATFGGVYADLDVVPLRDISELICKVNHTPLEMLVTDRPPPGLTNAFFAAAPQSEALLNFVRTLPSRAQKWYVSMGLLPPHFEILLSSGSTIYWRYMAGEADQRKIAHILHPEWGACSLCKSSCPAQEGAFFAHRRGNVCCQSSIP